MSNVLIGIIGVILFIGLALAGALILGDDFRNAKSSTMSAQVVGQMQQVVSAVNMYQLKTGVTMLAVNYPTNIATLTPRFLKSPPKGPVGDGFTTVDVNGNGTATRVDHVYVPIGATSDQNAKNACIAINEQAGATDPVAALGPMTSAAAWGPFIAASKPMGCFTFAPNGAYLAYLKI